MSLGGGGSSSSWSESGPWQQAQPHLEQIYGTAQQLQNDPIQAYGPSRVADESPETLAYRQAVQQQAMQGAPELAAGRQTIGATAGGEYLNNNPYRAQAFGADLDDLTRQYKQVVGQTHGGYESSGRFGSGMHDRSLREADRAYAGELMKARDRTYFQDYQQERGLQQQAAQAAPGVAMGRYQELGQAGDVGQQYDARSQQLLDDLVQKFEYYQREPWERLGLYSQAMGTSPVMQQKSASESMNFSLPCWAAAEFYGWFTPDWFRCAYWINAAWPAESDRGVRFIDWYERRGRQLAAAIREDVSVREAWRPFFEWCRKKGS